MSVIRLPTGSKEEMKLFDRKSSVRDNSTQLGSPTYLRQLNLDLEVTYRIARLLGRAAEYFRRLKSILFAYGWPLEDGIFIGVRVLNG